jgi:uncharacterized protein (TIGR00730 family)
MDTTNPHTAAQAVAYTPLEEAPPALRDLPPRIDAPLATLAAEVVPNDHGFATAALADLTEAAAMLEPFADRPRAVIFGSARIADDSPLYASVRSLAAELAADGFVVLTGGGPGAMAAGLDGAGRGNAAGVSVDLPFETPAEFDGVPVITQRRFFTRKLALVRSTRVVIVAPGGFGTLDELFEVLTLLQTGKKEPTPVLLFDDAAGSHFAPLVTLVEHLAAAGFIADEDVALLTHVRSVEDAVATLRRFWSTYRGFTHQAGRATLELAASPALSIAELDAAFPPFAPFVLHDPVEQGGHVRLECTFDRRRFGLLRSCIDAVNGTGA